MIPYRDFADLSPAACDDVITAAKAQLGESAVLLCHHYQRAEVYRHADLTGDSLKLSRLAGQTAADYLVFCGVHFMAEVADILSRPEQTAILPDMAAGCSMADMANLAKVERCWDELSAHFDPDETITPITYINSSADLKAFCGEHGGIVCTSSNASKIAAWALSRRPKILFFPDQHLGRWSGHRMGIDLDAMPVWDPDEADGGLTAETLQNARFLLWKGHCSVHQMFQKRQIDAFRTRHPEGLVISHPECRFDVCAASDHVGSTELIVKTVSESPKGSHWLVGTELNLVNRLADEMAPCGIRVEFMADRVCMCSTMQRIDLQHLAWVMANLQQGEVVNPIKVGAHEARFAKIALERMLALP